MSNAVGPVCHIPPPTTGETPGPASIPGLPPPAQPSVASLVSVVNQLRQIIATMTTTKPPNNTVNISTAQPAGANGFKQQSISYSSVRVYQNNDKTSPNYVDINVVDNLVMGAPGGQSWTYKRDPSQDNPTSN